MRWPGALPGEVPSRGRSTGSGRKTVCIAMMAASALQMGDGCELDVQSAAAFAQRNEELSYWQLQVWPLMASCIIILPMHTSISWVCLYVSPSLSSGL